MARVPSLPGSVAPVATPGVFQRSNATADDFGAATGREMVAGGKQLSASSDLLTQRVMVAQNEDNEREAKRLDVEFSKTLRLLEHGDGETAGYRARRGQDAVSGFADAQKAIEDARRAAVDGVTNPRVRQMFDDTAGRRVERSLAGMSDHVAREREVANDAVSEARMSEFADDAGAAPFDPKIVGQSIAGARAEVHDMAKRRGWAPEVTASKIQAVETGIHRQVIEAALQTDPAAAQAYYTKNKDKIDGRARMDIERGLEAGNLRQQSQAASDGIMSKGLGEAAALAEVRKIADPKLRDETEARVTKRYAENTRLENEGRRDRMSAAWAHVIGGGSVDSISPSVLADMGQSVTSLQAFEQRRAKNGRGYADATDPATDNKLHRMMIDDPVAFADYNVMDDIGKLDEGRVAYWQATQRNVNKAGIAAGKAADKEAAKTVSYTLGDKLAKEYMDAAQINYGASAKGDHAVKAQRILSEVRSVADQLHEDGKKPTREDFDKALKTLFLSGEVASGSWYKNDPNKTFFEVKGTPEEGKFVLTDIDAQKGRVSEVSGVPVNEIDAIVAGLKVRKLPITIDNILQGWSLNPASKGK